MPDIFPRSFFTHVDDGGPWRTMRTTKGRLIWKNLVGAETSREFQAGLCEIFPGQKLPLHKHAPPELYFILDGNGEMTVGSEVQAVTPGTSVYIPGMEWHEIRNPGPGPLRFYYVYMISECGPGFEYVFADGGAPAEAASEQTGASSGLAEG